MSLEFNEVVTMDHAFLNLVTLLHIMDTATQYSHGVLVETKGMDVAIYAFQL